MAVRVRELKVPQSGAKKKLLDATEDLVAKEGFDLVSVRDITGAVKANVAAVNYHFGSREGLMDLVMMRTLLPLCEHRISALMDAQGKPDGSSLREIISAYVGSLLAAAASIDLREKQYLRIAGRILVLPDSALAPSLAFARREVREKYLEALAAVVSATDHSELIAVWNFFEAGVAQSLLSDHSKPEEWVDIGIRCFFGGGLPASVPPPQISEGGKAIGEVAMGEVAQSEANEANETPLAELQAEEPLTLEPLTVEPIVAKEKSPPKVDKQEMLFDF